MPGIRCSECFKWNHDPGPTCAGCGKSLSAAPAPPMAPLASTSFADSPSAAASPYRVSRPVVCPACGAVGRSSEGYCRSCRSPLTPEAAALPPPSWMRGVAQVAPQAVWDKYSAIALCVAFAMFYLATTAAPGAVRPLGMISIVLALIVGVISGFTLIFMAFRASLWWGLGLLFVPCVNFFFVLTHWDETKRMFLLNLLCNVVLILTFMYLGAAQAAKG